MKTAFRTFAKSGLLMLAISLMMGCESSDGGPSGNATVMGNVVAFEAAVLSRPEAPLPSGPWLDRLVAACSDLLIPSSRADTPPATGGPGGITVSLAGPVDRSAVTADDGTFTLSDLPAGIYQLTFALNGEKVTYRGKSGQVATIEVGEDETVQLLNIRIRGGHVNIGNVKILRPQEDETDDD